MKQSTLNFGKKREQEGDPPVVQQNKKMQKEEKKSSACVDIPQISHDTRRVEAKKEPAKKVQISRAPKVPRHKLVDKKFHPIEDAPFYEDDPVPFSFMVQSLHEIEICKGESSKDMIKEIVSNVFRAIALLNPDQLANAFYFYLVRLAPEYKSKETGVGQEILVKAISRVVGRTEREVRDSKIEFGDLGLALSESKGGLVIMDSFLGKKTKKQTTLEDVMSTFHKIAEAKGTNSQAEKLNLLGKLLFDSEKDEGKYIIRWLEGNLKIGAAEQTVISALARAVCITPFNDRSKINLRETSSSQKLDEIIDKAEANIKRAISEYPDYEELINALKIIGNKTDDIFEYCYIHPGTPVKPMLAKPTKGIQIVLKRFENVEFTCEYKYDGFRGQIHLINDPTEGKIIKIFSRNLENMTESYPDVIDFVKSSIGENTSDFILDSELVAYDRRGERIMPFQDLTTRARKKVKKADIEVNVCIYAFDLLFFNGKSLLQTDFETRRNLLHSNFTEQKGFFMFAKAMNSTKGCVEEMQAFLEESIKASCEGLMVKTLRENSSYEPSKRTFKWLKIKKDYLDTDIGDSLDLVVVGADYGEGKRTGLYGSFLLAVYDPDTATFQTASRIGTGFSDEELKNSFAKLEPLVITRADIAVRHKEKDPDVWFEPRYVWEMKAADLTLSPVYYAALGQVDDSKGIGLRFPRFLRWREDKKPKEATSSTQLAEMYRNQAVINIDMHDDLY